MTDQAKKLTKEIEAGAKSQWDLAPVVEYLASAQDGMAHTRFADRERHALPSREATIEIVEMLRSVLFPGYFGASELLNENVRYHVGAQLDRVLRILQEQVRRVLHFSNTNNSLSGDDIRQKAQELTKSFLARLPEIRRLLATDVQAAFEGDPAATAPDETIFCYPGIQAITNFRLAHELCQLEIPLLPRIVTEQAHSITGIDIHPGAQIGEKFFIDHGTGVVIGETCIIGARVRLYQGVTLGAKSFPLDENGNPIKGIPRHPIVEDDVVIYSNATIIGRITIGQGSTIGGNVWLTHSLAPGSRVHQAEVRQEKFIHGGGI